MKRTLVGTLWVTLALLAEARVSQAQQEQASRKWGVGAGAGLTVPTGAYASTDHPGPNALVYFFYSALPAVGLGLDVGATWTSHKDGGNTELYEVLAGATWRPGSPARSPRPFLLGNIGVVAVDSNSPDKGRLAFGGGGGISVGRGTARFFLLARFLEVEASGGALNFVPITVGFTTLAP